MVMADAARGAQFLAQLHIRDAFVQQRVQVTVAGPVRQPAESAAARLEGFQHFVI